MYWVIEFNYVELMDLCVETLIYYQIYTCYEIKKNHQNKIINGCNALSFRESWIVVSNVVDLNVFLLIDTFYIVYKI